MNHKLVAFNSGMGIHPRHHFGRGNKRRVEQGRMAGGAGLCWQAQGKLPRLRNANVFADQPFGVQLHVQGLGAKTCGHSQWHGQQERALIAKVHQRADGQFFRRGPLDVARHHLPAQLPLQSGGQAGVAGVLPVGMPMRLVLNHQPQPHRLPRLHTLWRVSHQLGLNF